MTIRPIIRYPDRRLAIPARPVTAFDGAQHRPERNEGFAAANIAL